MPDKKSEPSTRTFNDDGEASFSASLHVAPDRPEDAERPASIGRYHIKRLLGHGGFGVVYLALDVVLDRLVAIKVPHSKRLLQRENIEHYLKEARAVAALDHPHIVPVYDVGQTDDYPCYIVSKYIEGANLSTQIKRSRFRHAESACLAATVAETLHYAHKQGLVHRDVKPANLLIAGDGKPYIVDFGLALRDEDFGKGSPYGGTLVYMSPEQARGEGHRVDGRTDIYSLGAVLYELLTGRRSVLGENKQEILAQIATQEPKPPRQIDDSIPKELERVCLKALAKRAADRYTTARDMADDLLAFLESHPGGSPNRGSSSSPDPMPVGAGETESNSHAANSASRLPRVVPKGLRSFDEHDADFFLELLPGPRDRDGLPDSLRFWKTQIEQLDPDKTFPVGLIYGPSGCGKTSLVKAGLLPRLSADVIAVYVEATPSGTEARLSQALVKRWPAAGNQLSLKELVAALRRGECLPVGKKVLIVLDQFEQWLHARNSIDDAELVQALRQCDGGRVQCLLMVRDDFWLAVSRFLRALEVRLLEGHNVALADLFDLDHARKVLAAFGRAFLKLPENAGQTSREQIEFLSQTVDGLADDGKIVCVRLALFAEMMKGKPWTPASLKEVGGAKGIGMAFLEETFNSSLASPEHRYHREAARAVLRKLLPDSGADIRGQMKSYAELLEASGYARRPRDFADLLAILDGEIRLITPTDPEGAAIKGVEPPTPTVGSHPSLPPPRPEPARYYQLTHDYLVPSLREWLTRGQRETCRGRAELLLSERAALWEVRPERKQLPTLPEWLHIKLLTKSHRWSARDRRLMKAADRHYLRRLTAGAVIGVCLLLAGWLSWEYAERVGQTSRGLELAERLRVAEIEQAPAIVKELAPIRKWVLPQLRQIQQDETAPAAERLRAALSLPPNDPKRTAFLKERLLDPDTPPADFLVTRESLLPVAESLRRQLWQQMLGRNDGIKLRSACALALFDRDNVRWSEHSDDVARQLIEQPPIFILGWIKALRPISAKLIDGLLRRLSQAQTADQAANAATAVFEFQGHRTDSLLDALESANDVQFKAICDLLASSGPSTTGLLSKRLDRVSAGAEAETNIGDASLENARRKANLALALLRQGQPGPAYAGLQYAANPALRVAIIHGLNAARVPFNVLTSLFLESSARDAALHGLLLAIANRAEEYQPASQGPAVRDRTRQLYAGHPNSGIHSASELFLDRIGDNEWLEQARQKLIATGAPADAQWLVNSIGQTMIKVKGAKCGFALGATEVTREQFWRFLREVEPDRKLTMPYGDAETIPVTQIYLHDAIRFCQWLSEREFPEPEWCYPPLNQLRRDNASVARDFETRRGYRLPTSAEWETACRAGSTTRRFFGLDSSLLPRYAWGIQQTDTRLMRVARLLPNDYGLFDAYGNATELCLSWPAAGGAVHPGGETLAYVLQGSSSRSPADTFESSLSRSYSVSLGDSDPHIGFRIARSLLEE